MISMSTLQRLVSFLGLLSAGALALSPVLTTINPEYAAVAGVVSAIAAGLGGRLTNAISLPGGPVATGMAVLAAIALSTVNAMGGHLDPALATVLTGIAVAIAAFGQSVFGWDPPPELPSDRPIRR